MTATTRTRAGNAIAIGSFQAKTYFAELLRKIESGAVVTITRNGHDVAVMQSPRRAEQNKAFRAWQSIMRVSDEIAQNAPVTLAEINAWKNDGKK